MNLAHDSCLTSIGTTGLDACIPDSCLAFASINTCLFPISDIQCRLLSPIDLDLYLFFHRPIICDLVQLKNKSIIRYKPYKYCYLSVYFVVGSGRSRIWHTAGRNWLVVSVMSLPYTGYALGRMRNEYKSVHIQLTVYSDTTILPRPNSSHSFSHFIN